MSESSNKHKNFKAARGRKTVAFKRNPIRLSAGFSAETLQASREWRDIFKVLKGKNLQSRILYPSSLSFRIGWIKSFSDKN